YLLVTLFFKIGVIAFAVYVSLTAFDLFTSPKLIWFDNYVKAFTDQNFLQSLLNVLWYVLIVVPVQTAIALALATLLNIKLRGAQVFRGVYYAPAVTSSVVITMIFWWLYLKTGFMNYFLDKLWFALGGSWDRVEWLNDPSGLFALILQPFGVKIPSAMWYLQG